MTVHSLDEVLGAEMRGALARKGMTAQDLAVSLGVTPHTAGARLKGNPGFSVVELELAADLVGESSEALLRRARSEIASRRRLASTEQANAA